MRSRHSPSPLWVVGGLAAAAAYSWLAAGTRAFSAPADVLSAIPDVLALALAWLGVRLAAGKTGSGRLHGRASTPAAGDTPTQGAAPGGAPGTAPPADSPAVPRSASLSGWFVAFGLVACWELVSYLSAPRRVYPTLSSLSDAVSDVRPAKAALFFAWLLLGWALVRP